MSNIRRHFRPNQIYFLTHVTYKRQPLLIDHFDLLASVTKEIREEFPFELIAWVILPDHCHVIIDPKNSRIPSLVRKIKLGFSGRLRHRLGIPNGRVWQNRYWDHVIRDEKDLRHHFDYIHFNPIKHGYVINPFEWRHSSALEYLRQGFYSRDWRPKAELDGEYGE
jgi:putative transposase